MKLKKIRNEKWTLSLFLLFFLFFLSSSTGYTAEKTNVISFGANTEGKTNQTEFIQKAINYQSDQGGGIVFFPKGVYLIDAVKSIVLKDNITLEFEEGTILKAMPNNQGSYEIINIHDVDNVKISGEVEIIGERDEHLGTTGEWGFGISVRGSNNVEIDKVSISNCWGDGIYLGSTLKQNYNQNVKISNVKIDGNRRQGISIISVKNLEIINARIANTKGTPPQGGITIEPNNNSEHLDGIKIKNLYSEKNLGSGLLIYPGKLNGSENSINILVDKIANIKDGVKVKGHEGLKGNIIVAGVFYLKENNFNDLNRSHWAYDEINYLVDKKILVGYQDGRFLPEKNTTRAEAAKMLSIALDLKILKANSIYKDVSSSHWAKDYIVAATKSGLFTGYPEGLFKPDEVLTRAEMSKILVIAYKLKGDTSTEFSDVSNSWAKSHISILVKNGITTGYPDNTFKPNTATTRAQFSTFLARSMNSEFRE